MDYVIPTLLIGVGVLGVKEHLAIKRQQMKQQAIITKLVDNNNKYYLSNHEPPCGDYKDCNDV